MSLFRQIYFGDIGMFYMLCFQSDLQKKGYEDFGTFFFKILFASDAGRRLLVN